MSREAVEVHWFIYFSYCPPFMVKTSTLMEAKTYTMAKETFMASLYGLLSLSATMRME